MGTLRAMNTNKRQRSEEALEEQTNRLQCEEGMAPIHTAAHNGDLEVLTYLLDNGARINDEAGNEMYYEFTALQIVAGKLAGDLNSQDPTYRPCLDLLLKRGASVDSEVISSTAFTTDIELTRELLSYAPKKKRKLYCSIALQRLVKDIFTTGMSIYPQPTEMIQFLLDQGANPTRRQRWCSDYDLPAYKEARKQVDYFVREIKVIRGTAESLVPKLEKLQRKLDRLDAGRTDGDEMPKGYMTAFRKRLDLGLQISREDKTRAEYQDMTAEDKQNIDSVNFFQLREASRRLAVIKKAIKARKDYEQ